MVPQVGISQAKITDCKICCVSFIH